MQSLKAIFIFLIMLIAVDSQSEFIQQWCARFDGSKYNDYPCQMLLDKNGNIYITGTSCTMGINGEDVDFLTVKYNERGELLWSKRFDNGLGLADIAASMVIDSHGNIYVVGFTDHLGGLVGDFDYLIVKYDSAGNFLWGKIYDELIDDEAVSSTIDKNDNIIVTGFASYDVPRGDIVTIKYDTSGNQLWLSRYESRLGLDNRPIGIVTDLNGNVCISGVTYETNSGYDFISLKINGKDGNNLWAVKFNGDANGTDLAKSIAVDKAGNIFVSGESAYYNNNLSICTLKYDSTGYLIWERKYNGGYCYDNHVTSMALTGSGNVVLTGWSENPQEGKEFCTIMYSAGGDQLWVRNFKNGKDNPGNNHANRVTVYGSNIFITGSLNSDICTLSYDENGNELWINKYNSPVNGIDNGVDVAIDNTGSIYVAGDSEGKITHADYLLLKYQRIETDSKLNSINNSAGKFVLGQNFPNPFNPVTTIEFAIPKPLHVRLVIYDVLGKEIAVVVNQVLKAGEYKADWDASNYPSGTYFYKLTSENYSETKRMVLIK